MRTMRHTTYNLNYHLVWIPKYQELVLMGRVADRVQYILHEIPDDKELDVINLTVKPDHVHLFVSSPWKHSPTLLVNWFKGLSSRKHNHRHAETDAGKIRGARGYYAGTAGHVSSETVESYTHRQEAEA